MSEALKQPNASQLIISWPTGMSPQATGNVRTYDLRVVEPTGTPATHRYDELMVRDEEPTYVIDNRGKNAFAGIKKFEVLRETTGGCAEDARKILESLTDPKNITPENLRHASSLVGAHSALIGELIGVAYDAEAAGLRRLNGYVGNGHRATAAKTTSTVAWALRNADKVHEEGREEHNELKAKADQGKTALENAQSVILQHEEGYSAIAHDLSNLTQQLLDTKSNNRDRTERIATTNAKIKEIENSLGDTTTQINMHRVTIGTLTNEQIENHTPENSSKIESLSKVLSGLEVKHDREVREKQRLNDEKLQLEIALSTGEKSSVKIEEVTKPKQTEQWRLRKIFHDGINEIEDTMLDDDIELIRELEELGIGSQEIEQASRMWSSKKSFTKEQLRKIGLINSLPQSEKEYYITELRLRSLHKHMMTDEDDPALLTNFEVVDLVKEWKALIEVRKQRFFDKQDQTMDEIQQSVTAELQSAHEITTEALTRWQDFVARSQMAYVVARGDLLESYGNCRDALYAAKRSCDEALGMFTAYDGEFAQCSTKMNVLRIRIAELQEDLRQYEIIANQNQAQIDKDNADLDKIHGYKLAAQGRANEGTYNGGENKVRAAVYIAEGTALNSLDIHSNMKNIPSKRVLDIKASVGEQTALLRGVEQQFATLSKELAARFEGVIGGYDLGSTTRKAIAFLVAEGEGMRGMPEASSNAVMAAIERGIAKNAEVAPTSKPSKFKMIAGTVLGYGATTVQPHHAE